MSEQTKELAIPIGDRKFDATSDVVDREQTGPAEWMSAIRRDTVDRSTPDGLRQTIECVLDELRAHSVILENSDFPPAINAIHALLMEIAECVQALHVLGESIPTIDVTGISDAFLMAMPEHPLLQHLEQILDQQRYKAFLIAKWGTHEERSRKALPSKQRLLRDK
ncbi:MAG: hypothetical protein WC353_03060 [Candidatus Peribacter sp.]|jgi:hypothetical protein